MHLFRNIALVASLGIACISQAMSPAIRPDKDIEAKVEKTLSKMTLDEKIGQMTELSIDVLGEWKDGEFQLDKEKLYNAIAKFKVGSVLNSPGPIAQTPEKWQELIGIIQKLSIKETGIPCIYGLDQNHGTTYTLGGTLFPQNINLGDRKSVV